jgi:uncharacterized protein YukE
LLRRLRTLPGEGVVAFAAVGPAPLAEAAAAVRSLTSGYADASTALDRPVEWQGAAAGAFEGQRRALAAGVDHAVARLSALADALESVADGLVAARRRVAFALADALASAEAVAVVTGARATAGAGVAMGPHSAVGAGVTGADVAAGAIATHADSSAAADIAAHVLAALDAAAGAFDDALTAMDRLAGDGYTGPDPTGWPGSTAASDRTTRIAY